MIPQADIQAYEEWLSANAHGDLHYMENKIRCNPGELFPGAKYALIFVTYYKQEKIEFATGKGVIASYARGRDYHHVHRKRLKKMIQWLEEKSGQKEIAKGFSDSTPVLEKALAVKAGLGWFGKNSLLIHRRFGTFTLLSGVFTSLEITDHPKELDLRLPKCGVCTRCLDACPAQAIEKPYYVNATKCLSYHLIESKEAVPAWVQEINPGYAFGCDICQDVCPHNVRKPLSQQEDFKPEKGVGATLHLQLLEDIEKTPERLFGTPLQRRGAAGLRKTWETLTRASNT